MQHAGVSELADEADSKSVVGNHVWVQVPLPALFKEYCKITFSFKILVFTGFVEYQIKTKFKIRHKNIMFYTKM